MPRGFLTEQKTCPTCGAVIAAGSAMGRWTWHSKGRCVQIEQPVTNLTSPEPRTAPRRAEVDVVDPTGLLDQMRALIREHKALRQTVKEWEKLAASLVEEVQRARG